MISSSSSTSWSELESSEWSGGRQKFGRRNRPQWLAPHHDRPRGPRKAPLGIHARGSRRGTFKCLSRGKTRAAHLLIGACKAVDVPEEVAVK
jgi:hypothetical protein